MIRRLTLIPLLLASVLALDGCMWEFGTGESGGGYPVPFGGTVSGTPITGTYSATAVSDTTCLSGNGLRIFVELRNDAGSVSKSECLSYAPPYASGTYRITGGTGAYAGATGSGIVTMAFGPNGFTTTEIGSFTVPGVASAATTTKKHTFRAHGTISHPARLVAHDLKRS